MSLIQPIRETVEVVGEETRVCVQGHGRSRAEHPLDRRFTFTPPLTRTKPPYAEAREV